MDQLDVRLVEKSIEAFVMGLEIYNKPTIKYRVEGFSFFICNAWELMLKAHLINTNGESSIYYKDNPDRTISLENCIKEVFTNQNDPLRQNLEKIIDLRNTSTHFITEDYEMIYAPLFQACIFNYIDKMSGFHKKDITEFITQTFLSLVVKEDNLTPDYIKAKYPKEVSSKILKLKQEISTIQRNNNPNFSVDIEHKLYITKKSSESDMTVRISKEGEIPVKIIKEQQDPANTHPYSQKNCITQINKLIKRKKIDFEHNQTSYKTPRNVFNSYDFQLFINFFDCKKNTTYSYNHVVGGSSYYSYSMKLIDFIVDEIAKDPKLIISNLKKKRR